MPNPEENRTPDDKINGNRNPRLIIEATRGSERFIINRTNAIRKAVLDKLAESTPTPYHIEGIAEIRIEGEEPLTVNQLLLQRRGKTYEILAASSFGEPVPVEKRKDPQKKKKEPWRPWKRK